MDLRFLPKLLLQHDSSPQEVLEDVQGALLRALRQRQVSAALSPSGDGLAVALGQRLVVLRGLLSSTGPSSGGGGGSAAAPSVDFVSAVDAPEALTALAWLAAAGAQAADECILAGTSHGFLQLHSAASGALLLRQQLHHSAAVSAAVRWGGSGSDPDDLSEDVTLCFADAVVRLPAWEVWATVRWATGRGGGAGGSWWHGGGGGDGAGSAGPQHHHQLSFSKFQLPKSTGPRLHALCLGPPPPSLHAALTGRAEGPRLRILTAGAGPPLAAYEGEEAASQGLLSLVSDLASSTASSLLGAARSYVPRPAAAAGRTLLRGLRRSGSRGSLASSAGGSAADLSQLGQQAGGGRARGKDKIPGEPASLAAAVWDEKRSITQMAPSPCGRLAACCDSLGRILLVDTQQTLVARMLKGYREAQVAWLVCSGGGGRGWLPRQRSLPPRGLCGGSAASLESYSSVGGSAADLAAVEQQGQREVQQAARQQGAGTAREEEDDEQQGVEEQQRRQQQGAPAGQAGSLQRLGCLADEGQHVCRHLLVTFAPRRAAVEVWEPQTMTRLASVQCKVTQGLLLQQPARRVAAGSAAGTAAQHACNRCMLLDVASLMLTDLTDTLTAALTGGGGARVPVVPVVPKVKDYVARFARPEDVATLEEAEKHGGGAEGMSEDDGFLSSSSDEEEDQAAGKME
ncbi:hypothetical protein ABPG75_000430 [Micractinium tetrahymenae]